MKLWMISIACLLYCTAVSRAQESVHLSDDEILRLVLSTSFPDSGFAVVVPTTGCGDFGLQGIAVALGDVKQIEAIKSSICKNFACQGYDVSVLLDSLIARNAMPWNITLDSCLEKGYFVDRNLIYRRYVLRFPKPGWDEWHRDHPKAHGLTQVSLPAYDAKSGLCLIFVGTIRGGLDGAGSLLLYRYEDGLFKLLGRIFLWEV
ncbi:MAG: hypothetical protein ABR899_00965 [Candidatus Krumholzibacteriaceae bacterium]